MSFVKRTYVDQETVITAENLNAIQDAIIENEGAIEDQGEAIEGKYSKPAGGIPATDMASGVQTSLGKADSAYQKPSGGIPTSDMASGVQTSLGKADTAYQKPSGGIPATDLASAVQTSLSAADTAYQKPSGGIPASDMASGVQTSLGKADSAYQKPSGGIPASDMASGVQTSLGKADTALQSSDIDNTLSVTGKAADAKKTGDEISDLKNTLNHKADAIYDIASGDIASFPDGADGLPVKDLTVDIEPVQSGTGDPSPTNVRPISGWTGCNVSRTGINIWDEEWESGDYDPSTGTKRNDSGRIRSKNYINCLSNTQYFFVHPSNINNAYVIFCDASQNFISSKYCSKWESGASSPLFTTPTNAAFITFFVWAGTPVTIYNHDISINYPSTDHDYHPGTGNSVIPISWQSEAGTVYGGTLDVTNGVLTVDRAATTIGALSDWFTQGGNYARYVTNGLRNVIKKSDSEICVLSDIYPSRSNASSVANANQVYSNSTGQINFNDLEYQEQSQAGIDAFVAARSSAQIVYKLATPLVIQLDPVTVTTLLGQNNIWADTGDSTVEYPADTKLYIDKKLAALVAALS